MYKKVMVFCYPPSLSFYLLYFVCFSLLLSSLYTTILVLSTHFFKKF